MKAYFPLNVKWILYIKICLINISCTDLHEKFKWIRDYQRKSLKNYLGVLCCMISFNILSFNVLYGAYTIWIQNTGLSKIIPIYHILFIVVFFNTFQQSWKVFMHSVCLSVCPRSNSRKYSSNVLKLICYSYLT